MSSLTFKSNVTYEIAKDGKTIILNKDEMKEVLLQPPVQSLLAELRGEILPTVSPPSLATSRETYTSRAKTEVRFPVGYTELFRLEEDPSASRKTTFIYAHNPSTGEYGFKTINSSGEISAFNKVGSVKNPTSILGGFIRAFPKEEKPVIKRQLLEMGIPNVTEGRRLKALIDIAEHLDFLRSLPQTEGKRTQYVATDKLRALGGESG